MLKVYLPAALAVSMVVNVLVEVAMAVFAEDLLYPKGSGWIRSSALVNLSRDYSGLVVLEYPESTHIENISCETSHYAPLFFFIDSRMCSTK